MSGSLLPAGGLPSVRRRALRRSDWLQADLCDGVPISSCGPPISGVPGDSHASWSIRVFLRADSRHRTLHSSGRRWTTRRCAATCSGLIRPGQCKEQKRTASPEGVALCGHPPATRIGCARCVRKDAVFDAAAGRRWQNLDTGPLMTVFCRGRQAGQGWPKHRSRRVLPWPSDTDVVRRLVNGSVTRRSQRSAQSIFAMVFKPTPYGGCRIGNTSSPTKTRYLGYVRCPQSLLSDPVVVATPAAAHRCRLCWVGAFILMVCAD